MGTVIDLKQRRLSIDAKKYRLLQDEFWLDLFTYAEGRPPEDPEEIFVWKAEHWHPVDVGGSLLGGSAEKLAKQADLILSDFPATDPWDAVFQGWLMRRTL